MLVGRSSATGDVGMTALQANVGARPCLARTVIFPAPLIHATTASMPVPDAPNNGVGTIDRGRGMASPLRLHIRGE